MIKKYTLLALILSILFGLIFTSSSEAQSTPYTVSMDGGTNNAAAFGGEGTIATSVTTFYTHWDATYLYIGWTEGMTNYSSDLYYVAIDTNPNVSGGTSSTIEGVGFQTGNRLPDYYIVFENNSSFYGIPTSNGNAIEVYNGTSGSWNFQSRTNGNDNVDSRVNFQNSPNGEVRIRIAWSQLNFTPGNDKPIGLTYWNNNSSGNFMFARFPNENPETGPITKTLTHQVIFNATGSGINPSAIAYSNPFSENTKYISSNDGNWNTENNWLNRGIPTNGGDVTINNNLDLNINASVNKVTVNAGSSLTVNSGSTLSTSNTIDGLTLESVSNSYSSLISDGIIVGTVNYNRHVNNAAGTGTSTTGNDLISPPLAGMTFGDLRSTNGNILSGTIMGEGPFYLYGPFDNSESEYVLFEETVDDGIILDTGVGYRTGSTDGGTFTFTGTAETGPIMETITFPGGGSKFNLIGNPYPSYINASAFLMENSSALENSAVAIYGYSDDTDTNSAGIYTIINLFSSYNIAPGQGFFVASNSASETVSFLPSMRNTNGTDDFILGRDTNAVTNLKLNLTTANNEFLTDIYFSEFSTLGLDPGYDASLFGGTAPSFSIYSHLVEENNNVPFGIQALGETDYNDVTIPIGVNASQGVQLTFSLSDSNIPSTIDVYLDDTVANTSTLLTNSNYVLTPIMALSGVGRFYLRFTDNSLNTQENNFEDLDIYMSSKSKEIVINGQLLESTNCDIYDIQGRLISSNSLNINNLQNRIDVSNVSNGIYIINLRGNQQKTSIKVIIE
ncbi:T9SS type A sorting domain-containing protein [Psychroserpens sp. Hel_I_66]|uniref:T9SS type A sorting domain-containing protein n=1 Tax=Psychroserpens sp. Hel_I_66 TaxID=1250004 RepID=UPI000645B085|nr:T9SS type A sorting domain-containing protein [Psychroserpens sp. Hel_I_66]